MARKMTGRLVALSTAAVTVVFTVGYVHTQSEAERLAAADTTAITTTQHSGGASSLALPRITGPRGDAGKVPVFSITPMATVARVTSAPIGSAAASTRRLAKYRDGTYSGIGMNRHGSVHVTVAIAAGRIVSAAIASCGMQYPCGLIDMLPAQAVARQSAQVDLVSGATMSSTAYRDAVFHALARAANRPVVSVSRAAEGSTLAVRGVVSSAPTSTDPSPYVTADATSSAGELPAATPMSADAGSAPISIVSATATPVPSPKPIASSARQGQYRDGTYSGVGSNQHGNVHVTVVIAGGRVVSAGIASCGMQFPCSIIAGLPGQAVARQSAQVDLVSGATLSSQAYQGAVAQALAGANGGAAATAALVTGVAHLAAAAPPATQPLGNSTVAAAPTIQALGNAALALPAAAVNPVLARSAAPIVSAARQGQYRDGAYSGVGSNQHGNVHVTVVVAGGRVVSAGIASCGMQFPCSIIAGLPGQAVARQSAQVDLVSGATMSSLAYQGAVEQALATANGGAAATAPLVTGTAHLAVAAAPAIQPLGNAAVALPASPVNPVSVRSTAPVVSAAPKGQYRDGTYSGVGANQRGSIQVTVVVAGGRVTSAAVASCGMHFPCALIAGLPGQAIARQSAQVDLVSGATMSSLAYQGAVAQALAKAGGSTSLGSSLLGAGAANTAAVLPSVIKQGGDDGSHSSDDGHRSGRDD